MDFTVELLRSTPGADPVAAATLEWKYRTLEEAREAGQREIELRKESEGWNGFRILDEAGHQVFISAE
jgi:hypothetical protein